MRKLSIIMDWGNDIWMDFKAGRLELFYRRVYPGLILYAKRYLGEESDFLAEDCVQDAVLEAWGRREHFGDVYMFKSFLYTTIKNRITSIHRKNVAKGNYMSQQELDSGENFRNSVIDQEAQTLLYQAIEELPEKQRLVFEMSFIEGLKNVEIAEKLGLSDSSVKKYKASALFLLRERLGETLLLLLLSGIH